MTPGFVRICGWVAIFTLCFSTFQLRGALIGNGLTNQAVGQATLYQQGYIYGVQNLGSNGTDGISFTLGEPEGGVFFEPYVPGLADGYFMSANAYGQLNGTNDTLLARLWGGRASDTVYPLNLDFSRLAPESVTYQVYANGALEREFTRGQPLVVTRLYNYYRPVVNPLYRRADGALGASIDLNGGATLVFPEFLTSAYADELLIRLNNPAHAPGLVTRMEVFGGGGMGNFWLEKVMLGVFGRPHRSSGGATLHARPGYLRLGNLVNSNEAAGVIIDTERSAAVTLDFEPIQLSPSNSFLSAHAIGQFGFYSYQSLGELQLNRTNGRVTLAYSDPFKGRRRIIVLNNGTVVHEADDETSTAFVSFDAGVAIGSITAHAKTVENLPGYHVKFSQPTPVTISSNGPSPVGDEVRLVQPAVRFEALNTFYLSSRELDSITITNETVLPPPGPPALSIVRDGDNVILRWPDPNQVYSLQETYFPSPDYYYYMPANHTWEFNDPYITATAPLVKTNKVHFFRLWYYPD